MKKNSLPAAVFHHTARTGSYLYSALVGNASAGGIFLVSVVATFVSEIFHTKPMYDSLLTQLSADHPRDTFSWPVVLGFPVQEGSILESCHKVQAHLPDGCILAGVEHGKKELFPDKDMDIQPGDVLRIIAESGKAHQLKERLLLPEEAPKTGNEHE